MSLASAGAPGGRPQAWRIARNIALWLFVAAVLGLLAHQARNVDWSDVLQSMRAIAPPMLVAGAALAACSHLLYSGYDLLGRAETGHRLGTGTVMGVTFISYAFNLNLGTLVGGIAFRYRLYTKLGLANPVITRVLGFSLLTNWFGYLLLAGALFCWRPLALPPDWKIDGSGLRLVGIALLLAGVAYLALCAFAQGRRWQVRGQSLEAPSLRMALLQGLMSVANWSLMGAVIWCLLQRQLPYTEVLSVFLVAAVAGVVTHIPGGLGVLEGVFVALLGHRLPADTLLGALLAYRALYYLAPLGIAALAYLAIELRARPAAPSHR